MNHAETIRFVGPPGTCYNIDGSTGRWAEWSFDRSYRYSLGIPLAPDLRSRRAAPYEYVRPYVSIGLNPSTATEFEDDPTLRLDQKYARAFGYDVLVKLNAFAFRATDPRDMKKAEDPVGPANNEVIERYARMAGAIVVCWGVHGGFRSRDLEVLELLRSVASVSIQCLAVTKTGFPRHPLFLGTVTELQPYAGREEKRAKTQ